MLPSAWALFVAFLGGAAAVPLQVFESLGLGFRVNPIKLETGLRPNSAGIPYTLLLGIEAMGFPTFWLLL